jgi:hypothetical protein
LRLAVERDHVNWSAILTGVEERSTTFFLIGLGEALFLADEEKAFEEKIVR